MSADHDRDIAAVASPATADDGATRRGLPAVEAEVDVLLQAGDTAVADGRQIVALHDPARIMPYRSVASLAGGGLARSEGGREAGDDCGGGEFDRARHEVALWIGARNGRAHPWTPPSGKLFIARDLCAKIAGFAELPGDSLRFSLLGNARCGPFPPQSALRSSRAAVAQHRRCGLRIRIYCNTDK
jgi:hypothetical protein